MRKQYHFWPAKQGFDAWDVDRLIALSRDLPIERARVDSITEVDTSYWFEGSADVPTVRKIAEHASLILEADLRYPIILGHDGRVMDGMHRIARALLEGRAEIEAVRFTVPLVAGLPKLPARRLAVLIGEGLKHRPPAYRLTPDEAQP